MPSRVDRASRFAGWSVAALAIVMHWVWALCSPTQPFSDFLRYFEVASEFAATGNLDHQGRPYIFQPPAWPFLLGVLFKLTGPSVLAGKMLNAALSSGSVLMLWSLLLRFARPGWLRVLAFGCVALCPLWIGFTGVLGTESLSAFLMVATVWALACAPRPWLVSGIVLGLLVLNRPQFQLLIPMMLAYGLWRGRTLSFRFLLWSCIAVAVVVPWIVRNHRVTGHFVAVAAYSGYVLLVNNNDVNPGTGWMPLSDVPLSDRDRTRMESVGAGELFRPGDEDRKTFEWTPAIDAVATAIALDWVRANPARFLRNAMWRLWRTYGDSVEMKVWIDRDGVWPRWLLGYRCIVGWLAFVAASVGAIRLASKDAPPTLIVAAAMYGIGIAVAAVFEGQGRYMLPTWPLVALLAISPIPSGAPRAPVAAQAAAGVD